MKGLSNLLRVLYWSECDRPFSLHGQMSRVFFDIKSICVQTDIQSISTTVVQLNVCAKVEFVSNQESLTFVTPILCGEDCDFAL